MSRYRKPSRARRTLTPLIFTIPATMADRAAYEELRRLYHERYQPNGPSEHALTDDLAALAWRLRRLEELETAILNQEIERRQAEIRTLAPQIDPQLLWAAGYRDLTSSFAMLDQVCRHQARLSRRFDRVLHSLELVKRTKNSAAA